MITGLIALFFILMAIIMGIRAEKNTNEGIAFCFGAFCIASVIFVMRFIIAM